MDYGIECMAILHSQTRCHMMKFNNLGHEKTCLRASDQICHKPSCTASKDGFRLEILDLGSREIVLSQKQRCCQISCAVTTQLICAFVFTYAKRRFSHDLAHLIFEKKSLSSMYDLSCPKLPCLSPHPFL